MIVVTIREERRFDASVALRIVSYPLHCCGEWDSGILNCADAPQEQLGETDASSGGSVEAVDSLQCENELCGIEGFICRLS